LNCIAQGSRLWTTAVYAQNTEHHQPPARILRWVLEDSITHFEASPEWIPGSGNDGRRFLELPQCPVGPWPKPCRRAEFAPLVRGQSKAEQASSGPSAGRERRRRESRSSKSPIWPAGHLDQRPSSSRDRLQKGDSRPVPPQFHCHGSLGRPGAKGHKGLQPPTAK